MKNLFYVVGGVAIPFLFMGSLLSCDKNNSNPSVTEKESLQPEFENEIVFDDFSYSGVNDPALRQFNRWTIVEGINGPPSGALYERSNISFTTDEENPPNKLMELTSSNRNTAKSTSHARLESIDMNYGEGTYAARVYFDNSPIAYKTQSFKPFTLFLLMKIL